MQATAAACSQECWLRAAELCQHQSQSELRGANARRRIQTTVFYSGAGMRAELVLGALERSLGKRETAAQHQYLQQRLLYDAGERLMDAEDRAVMMAWEG